MRGAPTGKFTVFRRDQQSSGKQRNVTSAKAAPSHAGHVWAWTAMDPGAKLVISWLASDRSARSAMLLMFDLQQRLANGVQLTTDGHKA